MPAGIQVWDESGKQMIDMTNRIPRIIDIRDIFVPSAGTWVTITGLALGPFKDYAVVSLGMRVNNFPTTETYMIWEKVSTGYRVTSFRGNNITYKVAVLGY